MNRKSKLLGIIGASLIGIASLVGTTECKKTIEKPEIVVCEAKINRVPLKISRAKTSYCTNLKIEGKNEQGIEQILYVFDEDNNGKIDNYGFGLLRAVKGSPFYRLSDKDLEPYLSK
jgi:hypothetical protein